VGAGIIRAGRENGKRAVATNSVVPKKIHGVIFAAAGPRDSAAGMEIMP